MVKYIMRLALLSILAAGCGTEKSEESVGSYSGITTTNEIGQVIEEDENDWLQCTEPKADPIPEATFSVAPAYPNPAYYSAIIEFSLPKKGPMKISIWEKDKAMLKGLSGDQPKSEIAMLVDAVVDAGPGFVVWDGNDAGSNRVGPGIYRCQLSFDGCDTYGDIQIDNIAIPASRRAQIVAFVDEHWSVEKLRGAYDEFYPDEQIAGIGHDFFPETWNDLDDLRLWIRAEENENAFLVNLYMWSQFVFGWDDFVHPEQLPGYSPDAGIDNLSLEGVSIHREEYRTLFQ